MLGYLDLPSFRFTGDGAPNRRVKNVQGLPGLGSAGPRDSSYDAPSRHGSITRSRWMTAAIVSIEGFLHAGDPDVNQAQYDEMSAALHDAIDTGYLLTWQRPDGVELQAVARMQTGIDLEVISAGIWRYQTHLRLDDPRGYAQTLVTATGGTLASGGGATIPRTMPVTFDQQGGGTVAVDNIGTRPTPAIFRIYGYATSAQIVLVDTGARITLTGAIAPGDFLEIDVASRTAKLNGSSPAQGLIDSANTTWFELPRGTSTLRLLAGANDAVTRLDVLYRPAYA